MKNIHIKNGRVVDPANNVDQIMDIFTSDGKIVALGASPEGFVAEQTIDATDKVVTPGFVDMSVYLRDPGYEYKATIESETAAAAKAGVTTLCCQPQTKPVIDTASVVEAVLQRSKQAGHAKVVVLGALTKNMEGKQLSEIAALKNAGCVGVTNGLNSIKDTRIMRRAMEYAASYDMTVFVQPMDPWLKGEGSVHEGAVATRLGLNGIPEIAETVAVSRELALAELTGAKVHFCRLSSSSAMRQIARAAFDGLPVTADVAAHQLHLVDIDVSGFDSNYHVLPPLRSQRDRDALRKALQDKTLSAVCSDHQPHDFDAKIGPLEGTEPGISSLETLLPMVLKLVEEKSLSLSDAISFITHKPAKILGLQSGTLSPGAAADICIFDPQDCWVLDQTTMASLGKNSPFMGRELVGRVHHTILDGQLVYSN